MKKEITEKNEEIIEGWYEEAKKIRLSTLVPFIEKLFLEYSHDYGTICHAIAASAIAAAWVANADEDQGGITGFQAGAVMWEFIQHWSLELKNKPLRLLNYENMLYPQHSKEFEKLISRDAADWLKKEAERKLTEDAKNRIAGKPRAHPAVFEHWTLIAEGKIPFGYTVKKED
jgi:hypothetical protein